MKKLKDRQAVKALVALGHIAKAKGMENLAKVTGLNRKSLYNC